MNMKTDSSNVWPYVLAGSAIGGAMGYLFVTESGKKLRHSITHPDELAINLEEVRDFVEKKARIVTDEVHGVLNKAKHGIEEGERAYHEAAQSFQSRVREFEGKSGEITATVHKAVDNVNRTAVTIEESVLDPIVELGALYKGIERGIRVLFGKGRPQIEGQTASDFYETRVVG